MAYVLLAVAIVSEVIGTLSMRQSEGFTKIGYVVVLVVCYGVAFVLLAQVLKMGMKVGVAYGIWSACGVALVAAAGALLFGEKLTWVQVAGLALVMAGVAALELGAAS